MIIRLKTYDLRFRDLMFCCMFITYLASPVYAHKVNIYAYAEDGMIYSESYFGDGSKCKNSLVEVFDEKSGTKLLEGETDDEGRFSFKIPRTTSLKLVLNAGMGHQADFTLSEDEVREAMGVKQPLKSLSVKMPSKSEESAGIKTLPESVIEAIVESVVDKKLGSMMRMLVELQESINKPDITEIIGGIGYIIGILGIIAYFKAKRVKKN